MDYFDGKPGAITEERKNQYLSLLPELQSLIDPIASIQLQLYITNFMRMPEAWIQWRRTKVPELPIPEGSLLTDIVRRLPYPTYERSLSSKFPPQRNLDEPMWFEK